VLGRLIGVGVVAGVFGALFGVGGGIVIVPLLILLAHFGAREAAAISLGAIGITALAGATAYGIRGEVQLGHALLVGVPAAIAAVAGAGVQQRLSGRTLTLAFAVLLAGIGIWLIAA
jgi:uncharacterized membrane protein YfcA